MPNVRYEQLVSGTELQYIRRIIDKRGPDWKSVRWRTQDGESLFVKDMHDQHLMNSLVFSIKKGQAPAIALTAMEAIYRGFIELPVTDLLSSFIDTDMAIAAATKWNDKRMKEEREKADLASFMMVEIMAEREEDIEESTVNQPKE